MDDPSLPYHCSMIEMEDELEDGSHSLLDVLYDISIRNDLLESWNQTKEQKADIDSRASASEKAQVRQPVPLLGHKYSH